MPDIKDLTAEEYAETMHPEWGEFRAREGFFLYTHPGRRFRVVVEQHTQPGFGYDRMEAIDDAATDISETSVRRDSVEFVQQFMNRFCEHLSMNQLNKLIVGLTKYRDDWRAQQTADFTGARANPNQ